MNKMAFLISMVIFLITLSTFGLFGYALLNLNHNVPTPLFYVIFGIISWYIIRIAFKFRR